MTYHTFKEIVKNGDPENFDLNEAQLDAFKTFIDAICSLSALALPKREFPCSIENHASKHGLGWTAFQTH